MDVGEDYYEHWVLTHFLLDGHHKIEAAASAGRPIRLLSFVNERISIAAPEDLARCPRLGRSHSGQGPEAVIERDSYTRCNRQSRTLAEPTLNAPSRHYRMLPPGDCRFRCWFRAAPTSSRATPGSFLSRPLGPVVNERVIGSCAKASGHRCRSPRNAGCVGRLRPLVRGGPGDRSPRGRP
jgi:hypothetical protein